MHDAAHTSDPTASLPYRSFTCLFSAPHLPPTPTNNERTKLRGSGNEGQLGQGNDDGIGEVPGAIAELEPVDVGAEVLTSPTPAPIATVPVTTMSSAPTPSTRQASENQSPKSANPHR